MRRFLPVFISLSVYFVGGLGSVQGEVWVTEDFSIPDRELTYTVENIPQWKKTWDQARHFSRHSDFVKARETYVSLLDVRPGLDTARWEYTSILLYLQQWQEAGQQLDQLLAREPGNQDYLLARARVALNTGHSQQSLQLYSQMYLKAPEGKDAVEALNGFIVSLEMLGKSDSLLPLLEQLLLRQGQNSQLLKRVGLLALQQGQWHRGVELLTRCLEIWPEDIEVLMALADGREAQGQNDEAIVLLEKIITLAPEQIGVREKLANYYLAQQQRVEALEHIEALLSFAPHEYRYFLEAADLHMQGGRTDRALNYYVRYLEYVPEDSYALLQKETALQALASDLVVLVENSGSELLWQDLVQVTAYRSGVYLAIADILRRQHKYKKLADVLLVVAKELPDNRAINEELTTLLKSQNRYQELHKM